jgi:hypothetical protein
MTKLLKYLIPVVLLGIFMLSTYSVVADNGDDSEDGNHDGIPDKQEIEDKRQIQLEFNKENGELQIQSEGSINGSKNHIQIEITAKEGLKFSFEFSGKTVNESESQLSMELEVRKIIEFIDNSSSNSIGGFDSNDTLINSFDIRSFVWNLDVGNSSINNNTVWSINASTTFNSNASLSFQFILSEGYSVLDNNTLAPNSLKYSVAINNYTYSNLSSQIALEMKIKSNLESEHISHETEDHKEGLTHDNESSVNFGNGSSTGFFSWADSYLVDGVNESIVTSNSVMVDDEDSSQNKLYFSFAHGNDIYWDPKVGVTRATTSPYVIQQVSSSTTAIISISTSQDLPTEKSTNTSQSAPGFELVAIILSIGVMTLRLRKSKNN